MCLEKAAHELWLSLMRQHGEPTHQMLTKSYFISSWNRYLWLYQVGRNAEFKTWGLTCKCKKSPIFLEPLWELDCLSAWGWRGALKHSCRHRAVSLQTFCHCKNQLHNHEEPLIARLAGFWLPPLPASIPTSECQTSKFLCSLNQTVTLPALWTEEGYLSCAWAAWVMTTWASLKDAISYLRVCY